MKPYFAYILISLCACSASDGGEDSGTLDTEDPEQNPACAPDGLPSGLPVGNIQCEAGICTVEEGLFWRGQAEGDADACPLHQTELDSFQIDRAETTKGEYDLCVTDGACEPTPLECEPIYYPWEENSKHLPIVCVSHGQATAYCDWAGGRLPTEAEWEKAARGVEAATYPWGERAPLCEDANFRFVSWYCNEGIVRVGSYPETVSPFGLLDTLGNVWEWTADFYDASWYEDADRVNPAGPEQCSLSIGGERGECTHRVIRGGGFNSTEQNTRAGARSVAEPDRFDVNLGFRCAYD